MPIRRSVSQSHQSLQEFYRETVGADDQISREMGIGMLNLIRKLDNYFKSTEIWSKTSHYHLWLLTGPESESDSPLGFITDGKRFILETDYNPQHYGFENTLQFDTEEMFFRALLEEMKKYSPWRECEELYDR